MFVNYEVHGKKFQAGPYPLDGIGEHYWDIKGYEGVTACWIASYREEERQLIPSGLTGDEP